MADNGLSNCHHGKTSVLAREQRKERHRRCLTANEEAILQQQVATIKQNHQRVTCFFPRSFFIAGRENRIMKGAGLGDLRPEDRQRLRQLIEDLALAESEKEEVEEKLKRERKDHDQQLSVLRARQFALFKDKGDILDTLQ